MTCLAACSDIAGARDELQSLRLDERLARLCHLRRQPLALPGLEFIEPRPLDDRQWRAHRHRVERHPVNGDRAAAGLVLLQRRHQDRPALEHQAFRPAHHPVDDRAFQQGAAGADHHPAKPGQPAAVVQRPQETLGVGAVLDRDKDVNPVRARYRCPGIGARQSGAGRAPRHPRHVAQGRQHRQQRRPEATALPQLGRDAGRHRLAVIVQQRKRRAVIDDVGAGAGDDVRPRRAIDQLFLVATPTLSGRSARKAPSASACDGVRPSINAPSATTPATLTRSAVPCAITQAEPSFTSVPSGAR